MSKKDEQRGNQICPLRSNSSDQVLCLKEECAFWTGVVYSTEHIRQDGMCAVTFIALKNSDGLLVV